MDTTKNEIFELLKESDVKFIRLGFCDLAGFQKNIVIAADELPSAFEHGVSFDGYAIKGFGDIVESDLLLFPNPATITMLPWRPGPGGTARFFCDIKTYDGAEFSMDSRQILKRATEKCAKLGFVCMVGAECEFYLFKTDENGAPTNITHDKGGYLDIAPLDKSEDIRREICVTLEEIGISPETSHHEQGPGQNEIDFKYSDALSSADNFLSFKTMVKKIAARNGLFASFLPKPIQNAAGSGLHVNLSLSQMGKNIFKSGSKVSDSFIAGILAKTREMTLFLNPLANSYDRFGAFEAPKYVSWSHRNRSQLIRIPAATGEKVRMELRSPDPSINPYLAFALILEAGLEGIEKELPLPQETDANLYTAPQSVTSGLQPLPANLAEAVELARNSEFVRRVVGNELLESYVKIKEAETEFTCEKYFEFI